MLWNFTLNRKFTFQSANNVPQAMALVLLYYCAFTPLSTLLGSYLADTLHWNEYLVTFLNMVLNLVTEYVYDRLVVYRGAVDTACRPENSRRRTANRAPIWEPAMEYLGIPFSVKNTPCLQPDFLPFAPWRTAYLSQARQPFRIAVEGSGTVVHETRIRGGSPADLRYLERTIKLLLWSVGG